MGGIAHFTRVAFPVHAFPLREDVTEPDGILQCFMMKIQYNSQVQNILSTKLTDNNYAFGKLILVVPDPVQMFTNNFCFIN